MTFKTKVQYYRRLKGMTQKELASKAQIPLGTLRDYEKIPGRVNKALPSNISRLAAALDVEASDLFDPEHKTYKQVRREDCKSNLQYYRRLKGMTQKELASKADVNLRSLQNYEQTRRGVNRVSSEVFIRLATALDVKLEDLLETE